MKLCPQCDFIYEDDQIVCDMDGKDLVSDPTTVINNQGFAPPVSSIPVTDISATELPLRRSRSFAVVTVVGFVLAALVIVAYIARTYQVKSPRAPEVSEPSTDRSTGQLPARSSSGDTSGQPSSSESVSTQTPATDSDQPVDSSAQTDPNVLDSSSSQPDTAKESLAHTRLTPGTVSAGASSVNGRGPVIVRLTNGAAIKADEAWEKREGIWYRQGSVVTFLDRSQVRTIERLPSPGQRSKSVANNSIEKNRQAEPAAEPKKDSKVTSFFKKTGRLLKKPFKL
jgi:hypothetical protein